MSAVTADVSDNERRAQSVITQSYAVMDKVPHFFDYISRKISVVGIEQTDQLMEQAATRMHVLQKISRNIDAVVADTELSYATRCKLKRLNLRLSFCIDNTQSRINSLRATLVARERNGVVSTDISYDDPIDAILRNDTAYLYSKELAEMKILQNNFSEKILDETVKREELLGQYDSYVKTSTSVFKDIQEKISILQQNLALVREQQKTFECEISRVYEEISQQKKRIDAHDCSLAAIETATSENKCCLNTITARNVAQQKAVQFGERMSKSLVATYNAVTSYWCDSSASKKTMDARPRVTPCRYKNMKKKLLEKEAPVGFFSYIKNKVFGFFDFVEEVFMQSMIIPAANWIDATCSSLYRWWA